MKRFLFFLIVIVVVAAILFIYKDHGHYGTLILSSEIEGLPIYIDENQVGITQKKPQTFNLPTVGVFGAADHEVVVRKEIDATHEFYFYNRFSFNRYIDVEKNPVERIALFRSPPTNDTYPPINYAIDIRIKPDLLARQTGLVQSMKLKHNYAWHMAQDENRIFVLSRADKNLHRKSRNEKVEGEFLEVYDKETFAFIGQRRLSDKNDTFSTYCAIGVDDDTIYIGDRNGTLLRFNKQSLEPMNAGEKLAGFPEKISGIVNYGEYLVVFGEGNLVAVFKSKNLLYTIDEKEHYPHNIKEIHDYSDINRVNSVAIHNGVLYACNYYGFINAYALKDGTFIRQINTIKYEEEWGYVVGSSVEACALYQDRYLCFSQDYDGISMFDTHTGQISHIQTLFPPKIAHSELFNEDLDMTKATDIYKMVFFRHYLIFSEVNALKEYVYVYDLDGGKIVNTFMGHKGDITALFLDGESLVGLSVDGLLYRWNLGVVKEGASAANALTEGLVG